MQPSCTLSYVYWIKYQQAIPCILLKSMHSHRLYALSYKVWKNSVSPQVYPDPYFCKFSCSFLRILNK